MQNARLSELERMLAKSNVAAPRSSATDLKSSQEYNMLMEENRVVRTMARLRNGCLKFVTNGLLSHIVDGSDGCLATTS